MDSLLGLSGPGFYLIIAAALSFKLCALCFELSALSFELSALSFVLSALKNFNYKENFNGSLDDDNSYV